MLLEVLVTARSGDAARLRQIAKENKTLLIDVTADGNTVLHIAAKMGHAELAKAICSLEPLLLTIQNSKGDTPGFPFMWETPNTSPNDNNQIDPANQKDFLKLKDMEVLMQKELLIDQALYDVGLAMRPSISLLAADIHRYMGKQNPTDVPSIKIQSADAVVTLAAPASAQDALAKISAIIKEPDDDVAIVEAPTTPVEPTISRAPSMPEDILEEQQPAVT
ncbi:hypothetical protein COCNU_06G016900 [Cocos nucifera]|uniref:Ankyrin repeat-containing protein n=1 Tax=Cocos nucifera TaxID=13894 RepID=A0A8K0ICR4_COCNU|nr:hypothetical protein COCNU_06G016900 [Cocos nucifera]